MAFASLVSSVYFSTYINYTSFQGDEKHIVKKVLAAVLAPARPDVLS
jgi:hypothetical protein